MDLSSNETAGFRSMIHHFCALIVAKRVILSKVDLSHPMIMIPYPSLSISPSTLKLAGQDAPITTIANNIEHYHLNLQRI